MAADLGSFSERKSAMRSVMSSIASVDKPMAFKTLRSRENFSFGGMDISEFIKKDQCKESPLTTTLRCQYLLAVILKYFLASTDNTPIAVSPLNNP